MFKLILTIICVMSLLVCSVPSLYSQDEEPSDKDLLIRNDLSLRPGSAEVGNSDSSKDKIINMPAEAMANLSGESKTAVVLVDGHIVKVPEQSATESDAMQMMALQSQIAAQNPSPRGQNYTVTGQMSRREPEAKPTQNPS